MNILDKIIAQKKLEVEAAKKILSVEELKNNKLFSRTTFSLKESVQNRSGIIAEFKRQSPSKGIISTIQNPLSVVSAYEKNGASGISILTDKEFFGGSKEDILAVRDHIDIPILRKDFMVDAYQFYEAKAMGADVVLLIAACLSPQQVSEFTALAHSLHLEVLLEIHTEEELLHFNTDIDLVGINNRNLKDFKVDLQHSVNLKNLLPAGTLSVAESGIYSTEDFVYLKEKGFDAFLMGEYFMKDENPGQKFEAFITDLTV
ncbi:indole-3-glycerol phosphate synthase TrpC [Elizabethkingia meningoseptica]|uniref:indole-3-glycerol phosphate synthase TrpC n=1 Tax=Elizabethkingia meningoseptica TaxID=238 RepID=UPI0023AF9F8F|nr:indole-3-glycerol phosphate synthase TrpC [Elizabethkingia meningoseptica]MDE5436530.1 indole-3-glycerol phosphate synthase TrpC [Elizabethkingia meningoseptica]MDE5508270.1 indole-3-glycerol phosphate synthase TrpC [Elizabethkingia meningoseptica]MDE5514960.1 indole-3-glycerol phosphate synthase TrpC [Elizabethkingia meningoseptica]MDE5525648.1 indole-3-glycerol phosphate synthase TrpC [Elizabethkingia meningoseptica]MDE5529226.1 indole-3-glycerol phosphate synthase TrpC [Elizabethkingia m